MLQATSDKPLALVGQTLKLYMHLWGFHSFLEVKNVACVDGKLQYSVFNHYSQATYTLDHASLVHVHDQGFLEILHKSTPLGRNVQLVDSVDFCNALKRAFDERERYAIIEEHVAKLDELKDNIGTLAEADYDGAKCYLSEEGKSGYMIKASGEVVNVFSNIKGAGKFLLEHMRYNTDATFLDCFEHLESFYAKVGFKTFKTVPNWTEGGPSVKHMSRQVS